jgi:DNA repair exonuclease SbcCD ATPase subunit
MKKCDGTSLKAYDCPYLDSPTGECMAQKTCKGIKDSEQQSIAIKNINGQDFSEAILKDGKWTGVKQIESTDDEIRSEIEKCLTGLYTCNRVWVAWSCGTMTENDFNLANEDNDIIDNFYGIYITAQQKTQAEIEELKKDSEEVNKDFWKIEELMKDLQERFDQSQSSIEELEQQILDTENALTEAISCINDMECCENCDYVRFPATKKPCTTCSRSIYNSFPEVKTTDNWKRRE